MNNKKCFRRFRRYVIRDRASGYYICRSVDDHFSASACIEYAMWFDTALEAKHLIDEHNWQGMRVVLWEERLYDID